MQAANPLLNLASEIVLKNMHLSGEIVHFAYLLPISVPFQAPHTAQREKKE